MITIKLYVITDVHNHFPQMTEALDNAGYDKDNSEHLLIILGDLLDRGDYPRECLEFINSIERKVCIRGNHEDLIEDALYRGCFYSHDYHNGTVKTASILGCNDVQHHSDDYICDNVLNHPEYKKYMSSLVNYYETENYVFVHGWVPSTDNWREGDWSSARWENGMQAWHSGKRIDKTVVCGHYHTAWGHAILHKEGIDFEALVAAMDTGLTQEKLEEWERKLKFTPFIDDGIIALDSCVNYSKFLNCYVIEDNLLEGDKHASN